jgi:hypothetical protein
MRRIRTNLKRFFESKPLTDKEKSFILSALSNQQKYPQLHPNIWKVVCDIESRYKNE